MKKILYLILICAITVNTSIAADLTPKEQINLYYNSNDLSKAMDMLVKIQEKDRTPEDWLLLGNILQDEEKSLDAVFMYKRAILLDNKYFKAYYNLANIYLDDEKPIMAIDNYKKAAKLEPEFPYTYYNIGCAYVKLGELKKAKTYFLKAIGLKNTEPDFHYNLAYVYNKLGKPKLAQQYLNNYDKLKEMQN